MTAAERFQEIFPGFNKVIISQFETEVSAYIDYVDGVKNSWQEFFEKSLPEYTVNDIKCLQYDPDLVRITPVISYI